MAARVARPYQDPTMTFAEQLKQLPAITHLAGLQLIDDQGALAATIENKQGQAGSVAVYAALGERFGRIDQAAALAGLEIYAEHTADARAHPGKHPNIDRLLAVAQGQGDYTVKPLPLSSSL